MGHGRRCLPPMTPLAYIPSPSDNGFYIGPLFFHFYGIMYVLAVAAAIWIARRRWAAQGGDPEIAYEAAKWGFPAGLVGGRIYFCVTTPSQIPSHWWGVFAIWDGGLGIWGGIAAGVAVGVWRLRRLLPWSDVLRFWDAATPGLLVAQSIGRVGNYFNQELFGKPSTLPWALKISLAHREAELPSKYWHDATFQPTFLYEIIWNLLLAGFLVWLSQPDDGRKAQSGEAGSRAGRLRPRKIRPPGLFALYVAGYSAFRIFEETLRIDYSQYILGMRLNFWIALIGTLGGLIWFVILELVRPPTERGSAAGPAGPTAEYSRSGSR
jgi:prolipoprotein diacylglyceryl transferase